MKRLAGLFLLGSLLFTSVAGAVPTVSFAPKTDYPTGLRPSGVTIGDLNFDGKPDLVVANSITNTVSVLLGNGDGTFGSKTDYITADRPFQSVIVDLNRDGKPDLVMVDELAPGAVTVLINRTPLTPSGGPVVFDSKVDYPTGGNALSIAMADLNHDGNLDVVVAKEYANTVAVLLGTVDGSFQGYVDYPTGTHPWCVVMGDLNLDGKLDLAVANNSYDDPNPGTASVLLGNGDGTFGQKTDFPIGVTNISVAIGDLNRDGKPDLAVMNSNSTVSVLLGNGDGTFGPKTDFPAGGILYALAIGDVNDDGKLDLAATSHDLSTVAVLLGNGDGTFGPKTDFATGPYTAGVTIGDLNRDGKPDLVATNEVDGLGAVPGTVSVLLNNVVCGVLGVVDEPRPGTLDRATAFPNPFENATGVTFSLPTAKDVNVGVYDVAGRLLRTLQSGRMEGGARYVPWDGFNSDGLRAKAGIYFIRVHSADRLLSTQVVRVK